MGLITCGKCESAIVQGNLTKYQCEVCDNFRFATSSIKPRLCDVCAVGKSECQICRTPNSYKSIDNGTMEKKGAPVGDFSFHTKIKGVTMEPGRQDAIRALTKGQRLHYIHEKENPYDMNAIKVFADNDNTVILGYISRELAPKILDYIKDKKTVSMYVSEVTGGGQDRSFGCNIEVFVEEAK